MRRFTLFIAGLFLLGLFTAGMKPAHAAEGSELKGVTLTQLAPHVWMHTSTGMADGRPVPANGLLLDTSKGIVLIDTPWNDSLTEQLMTQINQQFPGKRMTDAIVTHAHDDRIGGLNTLYKYAQHEADSRLRPKAGICPAARRFKKRGKAAIWRYGNGNVLSGKRAYGRQYHRLAASG